VRKDVSTLFLNSALAQGNIGDALSWFAERQDAHRFKLERVPLSELQQWGFDPETGDLCHESGRFFCIEGIRAKTNWGTVPTWEQPIINQPEIGILGFITKRIHGLLHFLVQAKMEPGNINMIQLAPTLQATHSNFTRVHRGKSPPYLNYFIERSGSRVLVDVLQSEQGARFLRKRNRNIIIQVEQDVPVHDDYRWMTLGELLAATRQDNVVNMDARTVLSCIPYADGDSDSLNGFGQSLLESLNPRSESVCSNEDIISWFTEQKFRYELEVHHIPLQDVQGWERKEMEIRHVTGRYFSIIACMVESDRREVRGWTQPLVKPQQQGLIAFIVKKFGGVLHFLVQAKVEPGNFDVVEMAPTVQCVTGSYSAAKPENRPPFLERVLSAGQDQILSDTLQSEEGGRFYREENRNLIVSAEEDSLEQIPDNYIWMTAGQLKEFIKYNNFVNVQARCLLAGMGFA